MYVRESVYERESVCQEKYAYEGKYFCVWESVWEEKYV